MNGPNQVWCGNWEQVSAEGWAGDAVTTEVDGYTKYIRALSPELVEPLRELERELREGRNVYGNHDRCVEYVKALRLLCEHLEADHQLDHHVWDHDYSYEYRIEVEEKVDELQTLTLPVRVLPAPMKTAPAVGSVYYVADAMAKDWHYQSNWANDEHDWRRLERGLCFSTKEQAINAARAMSPLREVVIHWFDTVNKTDELLPCPFCGADAQVEPWHGGPPTKVMISCSEDGGECPVGPQVCGDTLEEAAEYWNQREGGGRG